MFERAISPSSASCQPRPLMHRRGLLIGAGAAGMALGTAMGRAYTQIATAPDYSLRIAPLRLELAPGKVIDTFAYNGMVPGPVLRLREGRQVSIDIRNDTDVDDIIHWHGLYVPSEADGAMEEGSPMVQRGGGTQRYTFTPKPTGTRWYHSHDVAGTDLTRSLYAGLYGFLIVEPASNPARYDQEVLLAAHHWEGSWVSMQDIRRGPPPDNGLEVMYASASFNDKMLGHGEPVRVREGQRVLFRLLNASPTENVTLALAGHRLTVIALDGNPVPSPQTLDTLFLAPAERADVIVEMNRPGVWILGGVKDEDREMGLGGRIRQSARRAAMGGPADFCLGLHDFRPRPTATHARRTSRTRFRKSAGRPRRLQSLDHQRQVLARCEPIVRHRGREALPPRDEQQERRQSPRPSASPHVRAHQDR
jgi:FtsP/CotA-like multicopper oxidase with cupredoxin domain